jgi:adenosylhomocysteine nucleosidase
LLVFVAAEAREFQGVLRHAERVVRLDWPVDFARSARLNGRAVVLVANGPGPKLAGEAVDSLKEHQEVEGLVSIGFCGALDPALKPADIVVAHALSVPRSHSCERPACVSALPHHTGILLSLDHVVTTSTEKSALYQKTNATAVEMESSAVVARATAWSVPFYAIKAVTDTAQESFPLDFNLLRDPAGRFSRTRILAAALRRPTTSFPALLNLNQRCNTAAKALGDFIADSRF